MKTIRLYGALAQKFGKHFTLDVQSPAEAIRALCTVVPGFKDHLLSSPTQLYRYWVGKDTVNPQVLHTPCSDREVIRLIPVTAGAKGSILGVVLGAVLIWASWGTASPIVAAWGATAGSIAASIGMSMVLGGVASLLAPSPMAQSPNQGTAANPSYQFNGAVNTIAQGNPVPVCYGEMIVGSQVISIGVSTQ